MRDPIHTPAAFGPSLRLAHTAARRYQLHAWRRFARASFLVGLLGFVPSVVWSFAAWGTWLLERQDLAAVGRVPLPFVESCAFAFLGWALIGSSAIHAWAESELAKLRA